MEKRISFVNSKLETRSLEDGQKVLEGYFIVFNQETQLYPGVLEEIMPSAVTNSLKKNDIRALFNHDSGIVLARVGNQTLTLTPDEYGLKGSLIINEDDREAMDIYARVKRGDINQCSFGFYPIDEEVVQRGDDIKFIVKDADILEVSIVTWGAYPTTEIMARGRQEKVDDLKAREKRARYKALISKHRKESQDD